MIEKDFDRSGDQHPVSSAVFQRSLAPMLICDEARRFVDANAASCLFLRRAREFILGYRIDDLIPAEIRPELEATWPDFLRRSDAAPSAIRCELSVRPGARLAGSISVTSHTPGRRLAIIDFPPARALIEQARRARDSAGGALTKREREVLGLVAGGNTGIVIAGELFLSPATVQSHVNNALTKLKAKNRAHGIALALRSGQIDLDDWADPARPEPRILC